MDHLHQIPPSGTPAHHHRLQSHTRHCTRLLTTATRTCTGTADQGHSPITTDIAVMVSMLHIDAVPGHVIETVDITIGVLHNALILVLIIPTVTPLIADHHHTRAHQLTLRTRADNVPIQHTNQVRKPYKNLQCIPAEIKTSHMTKEIQES